MSMETRTKFKPVELQYGSHSCKYDRISTLIEISNWFGLSTGLM